MENQEKKELWLGLRVEKVLKIREMKLILCEDAVGIIIDNLERARQYIDFLAVIQFFKKWGSVKTAFGLFTNLSGETIRKKISKKFLDNLDTKNLLSLLEGDNTEAYYNTSSNLNSLIGIELRYNLGVEKWDKDEVLIGILKVMGDYRNKIFNEKH